MKKKNNLLLLFYVAVYLLVSVNIVLCSELSSSSSTSPAFSGISFSSGDSSDELPVLVTSTPKPVHHDDTLTLYGDQVSSLFVVSSVNQDVYLNNTSPVHGGNCSIKFHSSFSIILNDQASTTTGEKKVTLNSINYKSLVFWIYPTRSKQEISLSLLSGSQSLSLPITNPINPINSFTHSSYFPVKKWSRVEIPLEYFPFFDYEGVMFQQRHSSNQLFIDDISFLPRGNDDVLNKRVIYNGGAHGYQVIIQQNTGVKLYQSINTLKDSPYSIAFNIKKMSSLVIEFLNPILINSSNVEFSFYLNIGRKGIPTKLGHDIQALLESPSSLGKKTKINLSGGKNSPCGVAVYPKNKWIKCSVHLPKETLLKKFEIQYNNLDYDKSHFIYVDKLYIRDTKAPNTKFLIEKIGFQSPQNQLHNYKSNLEFNYDSQKVKPSTKPMVLKDKKIINSVAQNQNNNIHQNLNRPQVSTKSIKGADYTYYYSHNSETALENNNLISTKRTTVEESGSGSFDASGSEVLHPRFLNFSSLNPNFVTSVGMTIPWGDNLPDVTVRSSNSRIDIKSAIFKYKEDYNTSELVKIVDNLPIQVLWQNETGKNDFQFLNLKFSRPFKNFYLIVGSLDNFEDVWVSASKENFEVTNNWNIISSGFLQDLKNADNTTLIKYKIKANQGLYLTAKKGEFETKRDRNYIILEQQDLVESISFSMVSEQPLSRVFYALLAHPNPLPDGMQSVSLKRIIHDKPEKEKK
ncbi:hypothetical protein CYY_005945 [Polysphondylium violaceum]|uniref:Uncharacterized protein n=1 Tax=Polysphondylium violaceum TaxID=133409 RepID=A0A8J4PUQ3_9MYCE|nr:hypothetical protein CYY_005945 [Polysphondylium violaceum]